ncbi:MAG: helix-turn-helix transcriptional regulator [Oscillospiraceae bacterium]|nr:helix-turn-helix transcriptional regulator [Oscillospiraceae bacterium]MBQ8884393.1 helix-turn-helix transcriptional regulator [Oscillospiraceae bacterium]
MYLREVIENKNDKSELVAYNVPGMPIKTCCSKQADFPTLRIPNHWHSDFELLYMLKGNLNYCVDGVSCTVNEGQLLFVNSARMHYGYWEKVMDCNYICTIIHPSLMNNYLLSKYLDVITNQKAPPFLILRSEISRERKIIDSVLKINDYANKADEGYELGIMSCIYEILRHLMNIIKAVPDTVQTDSRRLEAMHRMTGFIQQNFKEKISLAEIAASGFVSRSTCCEIFRKYTDKTPIEYLTEYRISKSSELLIASGLNVTEIAQRCGFSGSSYFTETFRKVIGCTPTEYRQNR